MHVSFFAPARLAVGLGLRATVLPVRQVSPSAWVPRFLLLREIRQMESKNSLQRLMHISTFNCRIFKFLNAGGFGVEIAARHRKTGKTF
jgi:hypothetical protein